MEEKLATTIGSTVPTLSDIAAHLIEGGGKRVRPTVILLAFNAFKGQREEEILEVATAIELIHAATLLHDDIIDEADQLLATGQGVFRLVKRPPAGV